MEKIIEVPVEVPVAVPVPQEKIFEVPVPVERIKRVKLVPQPDDCEPTEIGGIGKNIGINAGVGFGLIPGGLLPGGFGESGGGKGGKKLKKLLKHKLKKLL